MALGALAGNPIGAVIFNELMCHKAEKLQNGLLNLDPLWNSLGWIILMTVGLLSAFCMWLFNRWLKKHPPAEQKT
jgi:hypothetical protein